MLAKISEIYFKFSFSNLCSRQHSPRCLYSFPHCPEWSSMSTLTETCVPPPSGSCARRRASRCLAPGPCPTWPAPRLRPTSSRKKQRPRKFSQKVERNAVGVQSLTRSSCRTFWGRPERCWGTTTTATATTATATSMEEDVAGARDGASQTKTSFWHLCFNLQHVGHVID